MLDGPVKYEEDRKNDATKAVEAIDKASRQAAKPAVKGCSPNGHYFDGGVDLLISGTKFFYHNPNGEQTDSGTVTTSPDGLLLKRNTGKQERMRFVEGCALQDLDTKAIFSRR
jgi:hypothetical protein